MLEQYTMTEAPKEGLRERLTYGVIEHPLFKAPERPTVVFDAMVRGDDGGWRPLSQSHG